MVSAAQSAQIWQASLDDVRASFNPLFAASRQYEQQLARISTAEEMGAINAREAAAARVAAAGSLAPAASGLGGKGRSAVGNNFYSANIAAQGFDIGVTSAMGMNPLTIGLQQGSQLVGVMQQMGGGATRLLRPSARAFCRS
ncbi:hypothetical protein [Pseudorhodobacter sp.]|uniref:hypothetical protein n=1 Tax=Pseudorhodobacter sp. TaxID=1934400 RepID=UPI002AFF0D9E|nr:hypothetical protein [Pseudorhodobacter sp.]